MKLYIWSSSINCRLDLITLWTIQTAFRKVSLQYSFLWIQSPFEVSDRTIKPINCYLRVRRRRGGEKRMWYFELSKFFPNLWWHRTPVISSLWKSYQLPKPQSHSGLPIYYSQLLPSRINHWKAQTNKHRNRHLGMNWSVEVEIRRKEKKALTEPLKKMKGKEKTKRSRKKAIDKRNRNEIYSTSNLTASNREPWQHQKH